MKKVLIYQNRKSDAYVWDVSTIEKEEKAFRSLFAILDGAWRVYEDLDLPTHIRWYGEAKKGNYECLLTLLEERKDYEHEEWYITEVKE